ncbi:MAG: MFS transporter [Ktedonobacteraceae bacterium]|nr:MFS transporter [Ktedonobacteraceae bacterium]
MALQTGSNSFHTSVKSNAAAAVIARQDRIPVWALPNLSIGIIGMGLFFTFFDIGDVNVSFIQTCTQIVPGCLPQTASHYIGLPVLFNLVGYVIGALIFSPFADRYGRRDMMFITMMITGLGSLYTVFVGDYTNFILARTITGVGVGAELALVNTYINELAPAQGRAKYTSLTLIMSTLGVSLGIGLGLYLTTPAAPFPFGLPVALATPQFDIGWRILYAIGASLSIIGLLLRFQLPESPRWLISRGRLAAAEQVLWRMEQQALAHVPELPPVAPELPVRAMGRNTGYIEIFSNPLYFKRTILLLGIWLMGYVTVYSIVAGLTVLLAAFGYPPSEAGLIASLGVVGTIGSAIVAFKWGEQLERKYWISIAALLTLAGGMIIALSRDTFALAALGSIVLFLGAYLWLPMSYTWSTENYPTRARASGFALVDGVGHVGGGIGVSYVASFVARLGAVGTFILIGSFLLIAAWFALFGPATRDKRLDEVSP